MIKSIAKKRHNKTKQNGGNRKGANSASAQATLAAMKMTLKTYEQDVLGFAIKAYRISGRGCVNINVKNHPKNPYKRGHYYYIPEGDNIRIQSSQPFVTADDRLITEAIASYDPTSQAVVCVWHGTMYYLTVINKKIAFFNHPMNAKKMVVH